MQRNPDDTALSIGSSPSNRARQQSVVNQIEQIDKLQYINNNEQPNMIFDINDDIMDQQDQLSLMQQKSFDQNLIRQQSFGGGEQQQQQQQQQQQSKNSEIQQDQLSHHQDQNDQYSHNYSQSHYSHQNEYNQQQNNQKTDYESKQQDMQYTNQPMIQKIEYDRISHTNSVAQNQQQQLSSLQNVQRQQSMDYDRLSHHSALSAHRNESQGHIEMNMGQKDQQQQQYDRNSNYSGGNNRSDNQLNQLEINLQQQQSDSYEHDSNKQNTKSNNTHLQQQQQQQQQQQPQQQQNQETSNSNKTQSSGIQLQNQPSTVSMNNEKEFVCNLHKRPIEVICIDSCCGAQSQKCCYKCLTVKSEHSQHKSMDIDEAQEKFNGAIKELKEDVVKAKEQDEYRMQKIEGQIRQKIQEQQLKLQEQGDLIIKHLREQFEKGSYLSDSNKKLTEYENLLDIEENQVFKQAIAITKMFIQKKKLIKNKISTENNNVLTQYVDNLDLLLEQNRNDVFELTQCTIQQVTETIDFQGILDNKKEIHNQAPNENICLQRVINSQDEFYTYGSQIIKWDAQKMTPILNVPVENKETITSMLQFDEKTIILGSQKGLIYKYNMYKLQGKLELSQRIEKISGVQRVDDFTFIVSSLSEYNSIYLVNLDLQIVRTYNTKGDVICYSSLLLLDDHRFFITGSQKTKYLKLWTVMDQNPQSALKTKYSPVGFTRLRSGKFLLYELKVMALYCITQNFQFEILRIFNNCHMNWIRNVSYFSGFNMLISCSQDKTIKIWKFDDVNNKIELQNYCHYTDAIKNILFVNNKIISTSNDQYIQIWK